MKKKCLGTCPKCCSEDIYYFPEHTLKNDCIVYYVLCNVCKCNFEEEYSINYNITIY